MQMILQALEPESLALLRRVERLTPEQEAEQLDRRGRQRADEQAERDDRNRHERRRDAALALKALARG